MICGRCGGEMRGRRRNGFCSDRCRMAARREEEAIRRRALVARLKDFVVDIETELVGDAEPQDKADVV